MNQFWYSDTTQFPDRAVKASFNMDMVIRSLVMEDDTLLLVLSDGHEVEEHVFARFPKGHKKEGQVQFTPQGKPIILYTEHNWVQSKIKITLPEDITRYQKVSNVEFDFDTIEKTSPQE